MNEPQITSRPSTRPRTSPLRYPGGKGALYARLREIIRANGLAGCTYVEPYAGGAGAALSLLTTGQVSQIVINDLDPAIHAFWKTATEDTQYMRERTLAVDLSVDEWRRQKRIYAERGEGDPRRFGFAAFYLNRTNRSGVLNGGPIGGIDQTGNYKLDARFNRKTLDERFRLIGLYAGQIKVTSQDGRDVIRSYMRKRNAFIYADPPYFEKAGSLYMNSFTAEDHSRLANLLNSNPNGNWLLTYDNVQQVHDLYPTRRRREFGLYYSAHRVTKATELMIISDALGDVEDGWPA